MHSIAVKLKFIQISIVIKEYIVTHRSRLSLDLRSCDFYRDFL